MPEEFTINCKNCSTQFAKRENEAAVRHKRRIFCSRKCSKEYRKNSKDDGVSMRKCGVCHEWKQYSEYHKAAVGKLHIYCKICALRKAKEYSCRNKNEISKRCAQRRNVMSTKFKYLATCAKERGKKYGGYDIDADFLNHLWRIQNGKCFYSGIPMTNLNGYGRGTVKEIRSNVSLDRIDSERGYFKDNVVLCCDIVNRMKLNMSPLDFYNIIEIIHNYKKANGVFVAKAI